MLTKMIKKITHKVLTGFVFDIPHIRGQELCEFGPVWHSVNDILKVILQSGLAMKAEKRSFQSVKIKFSGGKKRPFSRR